MSKVEDEIAHLDPDYQGNFWGIRLALAGISYGLTAAVFVPIGIFFGWEGVLSLILGVSYITIVKPIDEIRSDLRKLAKNTKALRDRDR